MGAPRGKCQQLVRIRHRDVERVWAPSGSDPSYKLTMRPIFDAQLPLALLSTLPLTPAIPARIHPMAYQLPQSSPLTFDELPFCPPVPTPQEVLEFYAMCVLYFHISTPFLYLLQMLSF